MKRRDLGMLPLAMATWGAALLCVFLPAAAWACAAACGSAALVVIVLARRGRMRGAGVAGGLVIVMLAAAAGAAVSVAFALPGREQVRSWAGRVVETTAEITSSASVGQDGRLWVEATTTAMGSPGDAEGSSAPVRIGVDPQDGFDLGAVVRVVGEAAATDAGERSVLVVYASEAEVMRPAGGVFGVAATLKRVFVERSTKLPEPGAGLLPGLAVGDTRAVSADLSDDMRTSGLSHLTAVSGAKCHRRSPRRQSSLESA